MCWEQWPVAAAEHATAAYLRWSLGCSCQQQEDRHSNQTAAALATLHCKARVSTVQLVPGMNMESHLSASGTTHLQNLHDLLLQLLRRHAGFTCPA